MDTHNEIYRFRSLDKLLGEKELQQLEIYFSPCENFNDPMECYKNMIFEGNDVYWQKFIYYYTYYILSFYYIKFIEHENKTISNEEVYKMIRNRKFPNKSFDINNSLEQYQEYIINAFINASLKVDKYKMNIILYIFTYYFLNAYRKYIHIHNNFNINNIYSEYKNIIDKLFIYLKDNNIKELDKLKIHFLIKTPFLDENVDFLYNSNNIHINENIIIDIVKYFNQINESHLCQYIIASFTKTFKNMALWSYYADNHRGVCLIFDKQYSGLKQHQVTSRDIVYDNNKTEIMDSCADGSTFYDELDDYIFEKTEYWKHEEEFRVAINVTSRQNYDKKIEGLKVNYNFNFLKGIIFGLHTPYKEIKTIMHIIINKCKETNRTHFDFYQAEFDQYNGCITRLKLFDNIKQLGENPNE